MDQEQEHNHEQDLSFLRRMFHMAANTLGFSEVERVHLLNNQSPDALESFKPEHFPPAIAEAMAELGMWLGMAADDEADIFGQMRDTRIPGLAGNSMAEIMLHRNPTHISYSVKVIMRHNGFKP